jgi:hypothetical protein
VAQWFSTFLACTKPWAPFAAAPAKTIFILLKICYNPTYTPVSLKTNKIPLGITHNIGCNIPHALIIPVTHMYIFVKPKLSSTRMIISRKTGSSEFYFSNK